MGKEIIIQKLLLKSYQSIFPFSLIVLLLFLRIESVDFKLLKRVHIENIYVLVNCLIIKRNEIRVNFAGNLQVKCVFYQFQTKLKFEYLFFHIFLPITSNPSNPMGS